MAKLTVRRINVIQAGKISGLLTFALVAAMVLVIAPIILVAAIAGRGRGFGGLGLPELLILVVVPFFYGFIAWLAGMLYAVLYNVLVPIVGGLEVEVDSTD